jgi:dipeptidyl aminopeptidase/acylaminoacyl peptidase
VGDRDRTQVPESTSPDGTRLALTVGVASARDIWVLDTARGASPEPYLATRHGEYAAAFSPDGNWIAYNSDETGVTEVYLGSYRDPGRRIQVSTGGGLQPRWRRDGGELYYETASAIMAVPVTWSPDPRPGRPQPILDIRASPPLGFDVSADGQLFYVIEVDEKGFESQRLDVVLGWFDELARVSR